MPQDPDAPQRYYIRFDPDSSDEELGEMAAAWVEEILGSPEVKDCKA